MAFPYDNRGFNQGFGVTGGGVFGGLQMPTPPAGYGANPSGRGASQGGTTATGDVAAGVSGDASRGAAGGGGTGANAGNTGTSGKPDATAGSMAVPYNPNAASNNQQQITDPWFQRMQRWTSTGGPMVNWRRGAYGVNQNPMYNNGWFNPSAMGGYNPQFGYNPNQYMNPMWAAMRNMPSFQGNPGAAGGPFLPQGWTMSTSPTGEVNYYNPQEKYYYRYMPGRGWADSRNWEAGYSWTPPNFGNTPQNMAPNNATPQNMTPTNATPQLSNYTPPLLY